MPIIKWDPFLPFGEMDREFAEMLPRLSDGMRTMGPALDVYREGNNLVVEGHLPDVDPAKLEVSIENNVMSIKGESQKKREVDEKNYYRKEVRHGAFFRSIPLPAEVQGDKAQASYENGILKIVVPMSQERKTVPLKIKIKTKK